VQPRCWQQQKQQQQKQQMAFSVLEMLEVALTSLTDCWVARLELWHWHGPHRDEAPRHLSAALQK
jgi:hypothetical protein